MSHIGLPRLGNLVNVYTSSNNRNDAVHMLLPDHDFFPLCSSVKSPIFPIKNPLKNEPCANIRNCFWLGVVIELISSNWKVIASCADSYITDICFSCKRVINEWTHTRHNCESSRTHQYTRRLQVNKQKKLSHASRL